MAVLIRDPIKSDSTCPGATHYANEVPVTEIQYLSTNNLYNSSKHNPLCVFNCIPYGRPAHMFTGIWSILGKNILVVAPTTTSKGAKANKKIVKNVVHFHYMKNLYETSEGHRSYRQLTTKCRQPGKRPLHWAYRLYWFLRLKEVYEMMLTTPSIRESNHGHWLAYKQIPYVPYE